MPRCDREELLHIKQLKHSKKLSCKILWEDIEGLDLATSVKATYDTMQISGGMLDQLGAALGPVVDSVVSGVFTPLTPDQTAPIIGAVNMIIDTYNALLCNLESLRKIMDDMKQQSSRALCDMMAATKEEAAECEVATEANDVNNFYVIVSGFFIYDLNLIAGIRDECILVQKINELKNYMCLIKLYTKRLQCLFLNPNPTQDDMFNIAAAETQIIMNANVIFTTDVIVGTVYSNISKLFINIGNKNSAKIYSVPKPLSQAANRLVVASMPRSVKSLLSGTPITPQISIETFHDLLNSLVSVFDNINTTFNSYTGGLTQYIQTNIDAECAEHEC